MNNHNSGNKNNNDKKSLKMFTVWTYSKLCRIIYVTQRQNGQKQTFEFLSLDRSCWL